jgi:glucose dehydrogenase
MIMAAAIGAATPRTATSRGGRTTRGWYTYDPELDVIYWGIANPGPLFDGSTRPGANLYTNSILAIRSTDGSIAWYFQVTPHDLWDYDAVSEPILFDYGGRKLLAHFNKNGHLYVLDRTNGRLVRATRFVRATWGDVDPVTGVPTGTCRSLPSLSAQPLNTTATHAIPANVLICITGL